MVEIKKFLKKIKVKDYLKPVNLIIVLMVITIGALISAFYFYSQVTVLKQNPQRLLQEETAELVRAVSQLIILPENETPTVATVSDPERLKDQPFFAKAKKGDKVLIYTNARKAILYDPVDNKIVEVAPLDIGQVTE